MRDFITEIKDENFQKLTYGLYNMIEDEEFVYYLEHKYETRFDISDFEVMYFELTDKEKFLLKMRNKEFKTNIIILKQKLKKDETYRVYVDNDNGKVFVIRLKRELLN